MEAAGPARAEPSSQLEASGSAEDRLFLVKGVVRRGELARALACAGAGVAPHPAVGHLRLGCPRAWPGGLRPGLGAVGVRAETPLSRGRRPPPPPPSYNSPGETSRRCLGKEQEPSTHSLPLGTAPQNDLGNQRS